LPEANKIQNTLVLPPVPDHMPIYKGHNTPLFVTACRKIKPDPASRRHDAEGRVIVAFFVLIQKNEEGVRL
jgi:hypothetical protein